MMKNRRKCERVQKFFAVNIVAVDIRGKPLHFDTMRANPKFADESGVDFTPDGMRIMCSKTLPEATSIQAKMLIPDDEALSLIRAHGTIKWFKEVKGKYKKYFFVGVHFKNMSEKNRQRLVSLWERFKAPESGKVTALLGGS